MVPTLAAGRGGRAGPANERTPKRGAPRGWAHHNPARRAAGLIPEGGEGAGRPKKPTFPKGGWAGALAPPTPVRAEPLASFPRVGRCRVAPPCMAQQNGLAPPRGKRGKKMA